jgi:dephospho-CoA kinase
MIQADPTVLDRLNAAVHPLVAEDRAAFLLANGEAQIVLLDIPLLYETGLEGLCDAVAVVSAPPEVQRDRVLQRGMSEADFQMILARQRPDAEKRARADYVIPTTSLDAARLAVKDVLADIRRRIADHA